MGGREDWFSDGDSTARWLFSAMVVPAGCAVYAGAGRSLGFWQLAFRRGSNVVLLGELLAGGSRNLFAPHSGRLVVVRGKFCRW